MRRPDIHLWTEADSPWCLRVRWAFALSAMPYRNHTIDYALSERRLRMRLGVPDGPLFLPVMVAPHVAFLDGSDIAKFADAHRPRGQRTLFPNGVDDWVPLIDSVCAHERKRVYSAAQRDAALARSLAPPGSRWAAPLTASSVKRRLAGLHSVQLNVAGVRAALRRISDAVGGKGGYLVGGDFTYADMAAVLMLQFVKPARALSPLVPPAAAAAFANEALAAEFNDLLLWRDAILDKHWVPLGSK